MADSPRRTPLPPLAVVGVSALFPGSSDAAGFWKDILGGRDLITDVPESHWLIDDYYDPDPSAPDKTYCKRGSFLSPQNFDPVEFGIPPSIMPATDTSQLLALMVAKQVLEDASQGQFATMDKERISVILGVTSGQELFIEMASRLQRPVWVKGLREQGLSEAEVQEAADRIANNYVPWQESSFPGLLGNVVAGRIANRFDLGGTNCVTDAACASSLSALSMAMNELYLGQSDMVITGGVDTFNDISMYMCFSKTPALSPSGDCRPFSDKADGTMMGEGLSMMALKRLDDAERDGDRVYAVIRGMGSASDGRAMSVYAPRSEGQAKALDRAYEVAGYGPETVELLEAHGTGTKAGDAAEFGGLAMAFDVLGRPEGPWCALGSVKSQIGHTKAAAGAAGLFKVVMALHHKVLPPTIKVDAPNPKLAIDESAFYLNTQTRPWIRDAAHPRRAGLSAFGFGGSNFHVTLEEYTGPAARGPRHRVSPTELVLFTAPDVGALLEHCQATAAGPLPAGTLMYLARTTQESFDALAPVRLGIVASDEADLAAKLGQAVARIAKDPLTAFDLPSGVYYAAGESAGPVAFLFPGQGSQYVGMGADLAIALEPARQVWDEAAGLSFGEREKLHDVVFPQPVFSDADRNVQGDRLTATRWAQPAIGATSLAQLAILDALGVQAVAVGGHSFGELTALCAAGVLSPQDLLKVGRRRGELMGACGEASEAGTMTAVSLDAESLRTMVAGWGLDVVVANDNGPKQVVLSGAAAAITEAERRLADAGVVAKRLPVAAAFHSPLVAPAAGPFADFLAEIPFGPAQLPVYANAEAALYPGDAGAQRALLASQITRSVRFVEMVTAMADAGVETFVEVGPGRVLSGLVDEILKDRPHRAIALDRKGKHGLTALWQGLAQLAVAGVSLDFASLWTVYTPAVDPRGVKAPAFALPITGTNYGKAYPPKGGSAALPKPNPAKAPVAAPPAAAAPAPKAPSAPPVVQAPAPVPTPQPPRQVMPMTSQPQPQPQQPMVAAQPASDAYAVYQRAIADSHMAYLQAMEASLATTQLAFMKSMETTFLGYCAAVGGAPVQVPTQAQTPVQPAYVPQASYAPVAPPPPPVQMQAPVMPVAPPVAPPVQAAAPAPVAPKPVPAPAPVAAKPAPIATGPSAAQLEELLLLIVAEKTGYPVEMLNMDMALEADLGVDSIKRVEILGAMQERAPGLPEVDASQLASLRTLGQIVGAMGAVQAAAPAPVVAAPAATPAPAASSGPSAAELEPLLLAIVAEKTGYPVEMLTMEMALEADLGIDSIKRVEILGAMQERAPGLPEVDASQLASLRTLGQIVGAMGAVQTAAPAPAAAAPAPAPVAAASSGPSVAELEPMLLAIVAEKTGYPVEMLNMDMALEADLGIDSIKRVEILGAMQERAPGLPEVDASQLASLRTLGQIVGAMGGSTAAAAPAAPTPKAAPAQDLQRVVPEAAPQAAAAATVPADVRAEFAGAQASHAFMPAGGPRQLVKLVEAPATWIAMVNAGMTGELIVTPDGGGVAEALAVLLAEQGLPARVSAEVPANAGGVVWLGGLRSFSDASQAMAVNRDAFAVATRVAKQMAAHGGLFVTVQDTGGDFAFGGRAGLAAWSAGVAGLVKTAAQEWPQAAVKAIDLERRGRTPNELARQLFTELLAGGPEREVGLAADGVRRSLTTQDAPAPTGEPVLTSEDVLLASGGARGVTAATLVALANAAQPRIVLLGRTPLDEEPAECNGLTDGAELKRALLAKAKEEGRALTPSALGKAVSALLAAREVRETQRLLRKAGSEVIYLEADVRNAQSLSAALGPIREAWGPITAVLHGAGVLADKRLEDKTLEQFDLVFDTKVEGLGALLAATAGDPLKAIVLFSSVAGRFGNVGQADYAMANEVLNKVAQAEAARRSDCVVKSLNWGPWDGGMVTPELAAHFQSQGVPLLAVDTGSAMLVAELADTSTGAVEVVLTGAVAPPAPRGKRRKAELVEPLAVPAPQGAIGLEVAVAAGSHAFLDGHRIEDQPVVPAVLVLEWFVAAAAEAHPELALAGVRDLKVMRGIQLTHWEQGGDRFTVRSQVMGTSPLTVLRMELRGADNTLHYSASVELTDPRLKPPAPAPLPLPELRPSPWDVTDLYGELLFHGGPFQVIRGLEGVSREGMVATLAGLTEMKWGGGPWHTDVAALDGGLQLARLWGMHMLGRLSLPTALGEYRCYRDALEAGPIRCELRARLAGKHRTLTDLRFLDEAGELLAELRGVEMTLLAGETAAPRELAS